MYNELNPFKVISSKKYFIKGAKGSGSSSIPQSEALQRIQKADLQLRQSQLALAEGLSSGIRGLARELGILANRFSNSLERNNQGSCSAEDQQQRFLRGVVVNADSISLLKQFQKQPDPGSQNK